MIYVDCQCGQELKAADHAAGTLRKCPVCGEKVQFPTLEEARRNSATSGAVLALLPQATSRILRHPGPPVETSEPTTDLLVPADAEPSVSAAAAAASEPERLIPQKESNVAAENQTSRKLFIAFVRIVSRRCQQ